MASHVTLSVDLKNGATLKKVVGHEVTTTETGFSVNLCSMQYGQTKDVVMRLSVLPDSKPYLTFVSARMRGTVSEPVRVKIGEIKQWRDWDSERISSLRAQELRQTFVEEISSLISLCSVNKDDEAAVILHSLQEKARQIEHPLAEAIHIDISGQVKQALQLKPQDSFGDWGIHYLPSLARAHLLQQVLLIIHIMNF